MTAIEPRVSLPVLRGSTHGADCPNCPLSTNGMPTKPVVGIGPEDPAWLILGEGPGQFEVVRGQPFVGPSGQVIDKALAKIGADRSTLWVSNVTLCQPPSGSDPALRERAAQACKGRLVNELAMFPGKPVLTLGAVAARAVIPKPVLDSIDPPDTPKALKKAQKLRQQPSRKQAINRRRRIDKSAEKILARKIKHLRNALIVEHKVKYKQRPPEHVLQEAVNRGLATMTLKAHDEAIKWIDLKLKEAAVKKKAKQSQAAIDGKPKKPKKHKPVKITDICGTLFDVDIGDGSIRPVIPAIHPAALLRGGGASIGGSHTPDMAFVNLYFDASKVASLAKGKNIRLTFDRQIELLDSINAGRLFVDFFHDAIAAGSFSLDLETYVDQPERHSALMAYIAKIKVVGLATIVDGDLRAISIAWELLPSWALSLLQLLFQKTDATFHNGLYDRSVLRAHGFVLQGARWSDTLLAHHAAFPGNAHNLQIVTSQFFGVSPWKSQFRNSDETPEKLAEYNAKDTATTHALRAPLTVWLRKTNTEPVYELDKKMSDAASRMHLAGMPVDRDINNELLATFSKNVAEARRHVEDTARDPKLREQIWHYLALAQARVKRKVDPPEFEARYQVRLEVMKLDPDWRWKIGASKHIAALLQAMGVGLYQTTVGGDISTKKDVLESLTEVPIIRDILNYRENDKLYTTFCYQMFDRFDQSGQIITHGYADEWDRIHPIWNVHRISGRWASQWPVVSNVPKDKWKKLLGAALLALGLITPPESGKFEILGHVYRVNKDKTISMLTRPNLRRQIKVRPGRKIVGFDFEQIEARVIALISGDPYLCGIFADGKDIHIENARIIFPDFDQLDKDTQKQVREQGKPIGYGAMYLAQVETLHKQLLKEGFQIKLQDLALAIDRLFKAMAGVVAWQRKTVAIASQPPYEIKDFILGRRRVWPMGQVEGTEAVNYGVQTAAAMIMNQGMARMMPLLDQYKQADPIAQIHDAALFECWEDDADRLAKDVKLAFDCEHESGGRKIPFPTQIRIGDSWDQV